MTNFKNYRNSIIIKDHVKSVHVIAGDYSYYSGYYHGKPFDDCVMYLDELDNDYEAEKIDKLIIGKFCSIATGAKFMLGGTQGHNYNWIAAYSLDFLDDDFDGYINNPPKAHKLKSDTVIGNDVWDWRRSFDHARSKNCRWCGNSLKSSSYKKCWTL